VLVGGGRGGARDSATLTVVNTLDVEICSLFVALSNGTSWGANRLGAGETVLPGYELTLFLSPGEYSVKALDCYGEELLVQHYIPVASETVLEAESGFYVAAGDPADEVGGTVTLQMVNRTAGNICYVYIVPSTATVWGADLLGSDEMVPPGAQRDFQLELGSYHMRAQDCSGNVVGDLRNVALSEDSTWTLGDVAAQPTTQPTAQPAAGSDAPYQVTIRLYNDSDETIRFIRVRDVCDFVDGYMSDEYPYVAREREFTLLEPGDEILPHELRYFHLDMGPSDVCREDGGQVTLTVANVDSLDDGGFDRWVTSVVFYYHADGQMFCQDVFASWPDHLIPCESLQVEPEIYWYPRMGSFSMPGMRARVQNFTGHHINALEFGSVLEMDEEDACYESKCFQGWVVCEGYEAYNGFGFPWRAGAVCIFDVSGGGTGNYELRAWTDFNVDTCSDTCCFLNWGDVNAFDDEIYKFTVHPGYDVDECDGIRPEDVP
jgi:hypothetical protein